MALTFTTLNGTITAGVNVLTITAYTAPTATAGQVNPKVMGIFATGERVLITNSLNAPTLGVVRGYDGTQAVAHTTGEGFGYALVNDSTWAADPIFPSYTGPGYINQQEITITGATGSTAAIVTAPAPAFLNATGTSGAGLNLPVPTVGMYYWVRNNTTGVCNVYSVGATINTTTGTTAIAISATGNLGAGFVCSTSGTWRVFPANT